LPDRVCVLASGGLGSAVLLAERQHAFAAARVRDPTRYAR